MTERVLEGTWEEVSRHAPELQGRRVRLTALPESDEKENENGDAAISPAIPEAFAGLIGGFHFGDAQLSENTSEKFADHLIQKHKEGRL